ncbi:type VI secretion system baseplate subunit TssK [Campylobacter sp. US33a]|uniref:Type VI secretion system baseplate subunit TssK n=1 Tax=Campylobacter sp. CCS1377 TaxID=3158229 RepID=A0AAU7E8X8_9BACT|nr:type VI secretion system baseplate subunit TssK [Campylobacter sp. US33a]MCW1360955.1 type VI secretion system baseplate subunit TssK [Campylobacter jejuni]TEY00217.1 type VI secretion system baseplate subunit TssK [Campylobacter sp. US33a]
MADKLKVAWFDGLNIGQTHFEQQERFLNRNIDLKTIHIYSNLYGIIDLEFSQEMLMQGKIALSKISGIAQDGSIFNAPEQDLLPKPLEINYESLINSVIVLKIPLGLSTIADLSLRNSLSNSKYICLRSNIALRNYDDSQTDILHHLENEDELENTAFTQEKRALLLASLRLKLGILGNSTPDELELPIAKIKNIDANKKIELENDFIPTCLNISKIPIIRSFLEENIHAIKQHKSVLNNVFKGIDQTKNTLDFSTFLSLNLLKKWYLIFSHLANKDKIHPEILYEKFLEFQGELSAFSNDETFLEFIPYKHDNLNETFLSLINNLRLLFSKITSPKYTMAKIINNQNGFYDFIFDNSGILEDAEIYFAIKAEVSTEYLLSHFKTQSKIHTQSKIKNIVATQLKGINVDQVPNVPSSIPYLNGYIYYKIDKKDELFKDFKGENVISFYLTNNINNPDIKMWAVF